MTAMQRQRCGIKDVDVGVEFPFPLASNQRVSEQGLMHMYYIGKKTPRTPSIDHMLA